MNQISNQQPISEKHLNKKSAATEVIHKINQPHISAQWSTLKQLNRSERWKKVAEFFCIGKDLKNLPHPQAFSLTNQAVDSKTAFASSNQRILVEEEAEKKKEIKVTTLLGEKMKSYNLPFNFQYSSDKQVQAFIYNTPISHIYQGQKKTARKEIALEVLRKLEKPEIAQQLDLFKNANKKKGKKDLLKF